MKEKYLRFGEYIRKKRITDPRDVWNIGWLKRKLSDLRSILLSVIYTLLSTLAISFAIRYAGMAASLIIGYEEPVAAILSQLSNAEVEVPIWILFCGALGLGVIAGQMVKRGRKTITAGVLLLIFIASLLLTRVNGVLMIIAIGIIRKVFESGVL